MFGPCISPSSLPRIVLVDVPLWVWTQRHVRHLLHDRNVLNVLLTYWSTWRQKIVLAEQRIPIGLRLFIFEFELTVNLKTAYWGWTLNEKQWKWWVEGCWHQASVHETNNFSTYFPRLGPLIIQGFWSSEHNRRCPLSLHPRRKETQEQ